MLIQGIEKSVHRRGPATCLQVASVVVVVAVVEQE